MTLIKESIRVMVVTAMQDAYDEMTHDCKTIPDCFQIKHGQMVADFGKGIFASLVARNLYGDKTMHEN